jgi:hypothetical protein
MENSNFDDDYSQLSYKFNNVEIERKKTLQNKRKVSSPKKLYRRDPLKMRKRFSLNDENEKTKEDKNNTNFILRKGTMPKIFRKYTGLRRKSFKKKDSQKLDKKEVVSKPIKKDNVNRKFMRKNAKKNIAMKKKRGGEDFRVVGKVSAKLSSLIERLQQNTISSENKVRKDFGDKVVMAPRIKAALEKFNRRNQDQTLNKGQPYKRKYKTIDEESSQGEKEDSSIINFDEDEDEEEYEEDEDYEEGDEEEEEEEEEKLKSRPRKSTKRKKHKKNISNDDENDSKSEHKKKKKKRKKKKDT